MNEVSLRSSLSLGGGNAIPGSDYLRKLAFMSGRVEFTDRYLLGLATSKIKNENMIHGDLICPLQISSKYTFDEEIDSDIESSINHYIECGRCLIFEYINDPHGNFKELEVRLLENLIEFQFSKQKDLFPSLQYIERRKLALFLEKNTEKKFVVDDKYYFTYKKNNTEITFDNVSSINAETLCPSLKNDGFETDGSILFGTLNVRNLKTIQKVYLCGKLYDAKFEDEEFIKVYNDDKVKITPNTVLKCRLIIKDNPFDVGKNITIIKVYGDF